MLFQALKKIFKHYPVFMLHHIYFPGCGITDETFSVTDKPSGIEVWPWIAALYRPKQLEQGLEQQFCGGSLITDTHVLTASHCTRR